MKLLLALLASALFAGVFVDVAEARQALSATRTKIEVAKLGPQVGERVPDFTLKDQNGKTWTLPSIMGPKGAMLVFIRSADW
jgi:cytochrome oxidase Cu insertion factor (SCO1/SenC/PrrC family)